MIMKNIVHPLAACALALIVTPAAIAQTANGCFWTNAIVNSSPTGGGPLFGSGLGGFSGTFSSVNYWQSDCPDLPTNLSGTWSVKTAWDTSNPNGIAWSSTTGGLLFDTSPGDTLLFGNPTISFDNLSSDCKVSEVKLLTCIFPDKDSTQVLTDLSADGYSIFVRDTSSNGYVRIDSKDYSYQLGMGSDGRDVGGLGYDAGKNEYTTANLVYAYGDLDGTIRGDLGTDGKFNYDTVLKIGACIECSCVPEPSSSLLGVFGAALLLRRRRA